MTGVLHFAAAPRGWHEIVAADLGLDLLLAPRALQFPGHEWKALRSRLGRGNPATFTLPPNALDTSDERADAEVWRRESTHRLDFAVHAQTLVVTGDRVALRYGRDLFTHVGRQSMREGEKDTVGHTSNEIHESEPVLRRHDAGLYLWIPREQWWS